MTAERIAEAFSRLPGTEAVALSGSRTSSVSDSFSDYDIYVYYASHISEDERHSLYDSLGLDAKVSASFFEEGDEATDGKDLFDIMFRSVLWTDGEIESVYRECHARLGYTTCILYNISSSRVLFDRNGWLGGIRKEIASGYPEKLRENIIRDNLMMIDGDSAFPFLRQLELASLRHDTVSENHRLAALLASYFDVLFAYSRSYHPGEKRLVEYAHKLCPALPEGFDEDIAETIGSIGTESISENARRLASRLRALVESEGKA